MWQGRESFEGVLVPQDGDMGGCGEASSTRTMPWPLGLTDQGSCPDDPALLRARTACGGEWLVKGHLVANDPQDDPQVVLLPSPFSVLRPRIGLTTPGNPVCHLHGPSHTQEHLRALLGLDRTLRQTCRLWGIQGHSQAGEPVTPSVLFVPLADCLCPPGSPPPPTGMPSAGVEGLARPVPHCPT